MGSKYYYQVTSNGTASDEYHFRTAPADRAEFKMIVFGDNRPDTTTAPVQPQEYSDLVDLIIAEEPHIVIMTGDYVQVVTESHSYNLDAWERFTNITDRLGHYAPIYAVLGNHDTSAYTGTLRLEYFFDAFEMYDEPSPCFSFDYAGVHFTLLNSEEQYNPGRITGTQYDWLVDDLTDTSRSMKFVFAHQPLYPLQHIGSALDRNMTEMNRLQQLFEDKNVTLFAAGHDHLFDRLTVNGVVHIIAGGGGAPLYHTPWGGTFYHYLKVDVHSGQVDFTAIGLSGVIKEQHQLPYDGPIEIEARFLANNTMKRNGTLPIFYFSEIPAEVLYSWDGSSNSTTLTGFPDEPDEHTLDVYAGDSEGLWNHERFVFNTYNPDWLTTTTSTTVTTTNGDPPPPMDFTLVLGIVGVVSAVVVIVLLVRFKRK
jgi:3',5'-cyclic AMP phosphodiesterase CpdA